MPDEILSEIVNVQRTETTNTAEIRIFTKQEDGTYSPNVQHGVLTLIPAGQGPDGVRGWSDVWRTSRSWMRLTRGNFQSG